MQTHPCEIDQVVPRYEPVGYPEKKRTLTLEMILEDVCQAQEEPIDKVVSKNRKREFVLCRMVYCYLAGEKTSFTLEEIGNVISKDHTSVIDAIQTALEYLISKDLVFIEKWDKYKEKSKIFNSNDLEIRILPSQEQEAWLKDNYKMYSNYHLSVKLGISQRMLSAWLKHFGLSKRMITRDPLASNKRSRSATVITLQPKIERPPASYGNTSWKEKVDQLLNDQ